MHKIQDKIDAHSKFTLTFMHFIFFFKCIQLFYNIIVQYTYLIQSRLCLFVCPYVSLVLYPTIQGIFYCNKVCYFGFLSFSFKNILHEQIPLHIPAKDDIQFWFNFKTQKRFKTIATFIIFWNIYFFGISSAGPCLLF